MSRVSKARCALSAFAITFLLVSAQGWSQTPPEPRRGETSRPNVFVDLRGSAPSNLAALHVSVRAPDLKAVEDIVIRRSRDEALAGGAYLPPGRARQISLRGVDGEGRTIYEGRQTVDIPRDGRISIVIPVGSPSKRNPLAVGIASLQIRIDETSTPDGGTVFLASALNPDGSRANINPDDWHWGAGGLTFDDPRVRAALDGDRFRVQIPSRFDGPRPFRCEPGEVATICTGSICGFKFIKCADPVVAITAGVLHACAMTNGGRVFCWGDNSDGQLGSPTGGACASVFSQEPTCNATPTIVACPAGSPCRFRQISAGARHTCAIDTAGAAWCWGINSQNQLALPTATQSSVAHVRIALPATAATDVFIAIAAGDEFNCAITLTAATGRRSVFCWGANDLGQTGQPMFAPFSTDFTTGVNRRVGPAFPIPTPAQVSTSLLNTERFIVAGRSHACVASTESMRCWGDNAQQQVANGGTIVPAQIRETAGGPGIDTCATCTTTSFPVVSGVILSGVGVSRISHAAAGGATTCVSFETGLAATCWGARPAAFPSTVTIKSLAAGGGTACAATSLSTLCWGDGDWGQLGDGSFGSLITPFTVPTPVMVTGSDITLFDQVAAGGAHTCGLTASGAVFCWGRNAEGQIGNGMFGAQTPMPTRVIGI